MRDAKVNVPRNPQAGWPGADAPLPTRSTLFMRRFLPWQVLRFVAINIRMLRMIARGH